MPLLATSETTTSSTNNLQTTSEVTFDRIFEISDANYLLIHMHIDYIWYGPFWEPLSPLHYICCHVYLASCCLNFTNAAGRSFMIYWPACFAASNNVTIHPSIEPWEKGRAGNCIRDAVQAFSIYWEGPISPCFKISMIKCTITDKHCIATKHFSSKIPGRTYLLLSLATQDSWAHPKTRGIRRLFGRIYDRLRRRRGVTTTK